MWCPNCGNEVPDTSSFCMNCGTDLRPFKEAMSSLGSGGSSTTRTPDPTPTPTPVPTPPRQTPVQTSSSDTAAMRRCKAFMKRLDDEGYRYEYLHQEPGDHRDGMIRLGFGGSNFSFPSIRVYIDFDYNNSGEGNSVHMWCLELGNFSGSNRAAGLEAINKVANEKRFARFYLDRDDDLAADADCWIDDENCAQRTFDLMNTFVAVIDDVYSDFQRARWN